MGEERPTTANLGATMPRLRAGWTGMLDGTSSPTNPEYELDGDLQGPTTANQVATTPRLSAGWTGMLGGTS